MRAAISIICSVVAFYFATASAVATPLSLQPAFDSVIVFGDSLSDNGNGSYLLTNKTWPADPAYFYGRFSNGQTWVEVLASEIASNSILDLAYGGATVNNSRTQGYTGINSTIPVPAAIDQVSEYLSKHKHADPNSLFVLSGGANDAFFGTADPDFNPKTFAQETSNYLIGQMKRLSSKSNAKHFLIPSTPSLSSTPYSTYYSDEKTQKLLNEFTNEYAKALKKATFPKGCKVTFFDESMTIQKFQKEKTLLGYSNTKEACLKGAYGETTRSLCPNPDEYIFWDIYHPTAVTHKRIAKEAIQALLLNGEIPHLPFRDFIIQ